MGRHGRGHIRRRELVYLQTGVLAGKLNYTGSTKQAREGITLLPKTTFPDTEQPLLFLLQKRGVLPLWAAGQLVDRLIERTGRVPLPAGPEQVLLSPLGTDIRILPGVRTGQGAYLPPETRLSPERLTDGPEAVYRLCALLFHLLSGRILSVESLRARRADLRSGLLGVSLEMGAETALLALLDQGLRLEPSRRFPDPGALRTAMGEVQTILNQAACAWKGKRGSLLVRGSRSTHLFKLDASRGHARSCSLPMHPA